MVSIKNLTDLLMVFGPNAQAALDFISDETNHRKMQRYLSFKSEEPGIAMNILVQNDRTDKETKIRIAIDGGKFLTKEEWSVGKYSKNDVIGIAVITPCVQFILGLNQWESWWGESISKFYTKGYDEMQALQIVSGFEYTKKIVDAQKNEGDTAAKFCWGYGHKGLQWYLPCLLELCAVRANDKEINELLDLVGGAPLDLKGNYWSSTEHSTCRSWFVNFDDSITNSYPKDNYLVVRPVVAI